MGWWRGKLNHDVRIRDSLMCFRPVQVDRIEGELHWMTDIRRLHGTTPFIGRPTTKCLRRDQVVRVADIRRLQRAAPFIYGPYVAWVAGR